MQQLSLMRECQNLGFPPCWQVGREGLEGGEDEPVLVSTASLQLSTTHSQARELLCQCSQLTWLPFKSLSLPLKMISEDPTYVVFFVSTKQLSTRFKIKADAQFRLTTVPLLMSDLYHFGHWSHSGKCAKNGLMFGLYNLRPVVSDCQAGTEPKQYLGFPRRSADHNSHTLSSFSKYQPGINLSTKVPNIWKAFNFLVPVVSM